MSKIIRPFAFAGRFGWILSLGILALGLGLALGTAGGAKKDKNQAKDTTTTEPAKPAAVKVAAKIDQAPAKDQSKAAKAKAKRAQAKKKKELADKTPFDPSHPLLRMEGVRCQVHREGLLRQDIKAQTGRYDEKVSILDLDKLVAKFVDQGTTVVAQINCGNGRVWTSSRPDEQITAHDMLLQKTVRLQTKDHLLLQTPEMRYTSADSTLHSNKGYLRQMPMGNSFMIGRGQGFEIKLLMEKNTIQFWREYGNPAEMRKSEKPVLNP